MSTHITGEHDRSVDSLLGRRDDLSASRTSTVEEGPGGSAGPRLKTVDGIVFQFVPGDPALGVPDDWKMLGFEKDGAGAGGSSSAWSGTYVNDALSAASQAIQSFLSGQSLADARKLAAAEQFQKMAAFALPPGVQPPGFGEGGPMHQLAALGGRPTYTPPPLQTRRVNPAALEQPGQVPPEIMQFIDSMLDTADQGKVVTTGSSSSG